MTSICRGALFCCLLSVLAAEVAAAGAGAAPTLAEAAQMAFGGFEGLAATDQPLDLDEGRWQGDPYVAGGASRPQVTLLDFYLSGDLDGDGRAEAVVLLELNTGGSGRFLHLAVLGNRGDGPVNLATVYVGDRIQIRGGRLDEDRIILDVIRAGPADAACCPGEVTSLAWRLADAHRLESVALAVEARRLSLSLLAGGAWRLIAWDRDEAVRAPLEITLAYADGRFVGHAGCNSYFAPVADGDNPGEVVVGAVGATKMACPEDIMRTEQRFLTRLAAVEGYGFVAGNLALSYELEDERGLMLFTP